MNELLLSQRLEIVVLFKFLAAIPSSSGIKILSRGQNSLKRGVLTKQREHIIGATISNLGCLCLGLQIYMRPKQKTKVNQLRPLFSENSIVRQPLVLHVQPMGHGHWVSNVINNNFSVKYSFHKWQTNYILAFWLQN